MTGKSVIRTPLIEHVRRLRYQLIPAAVLVCAVGLTGWLWTRHVGLPQAAGEAEALRVDVVSPLDGMLVALPAPERRVLDAVRANEVVGKLDDSRARALLEATQGDLTRLRKELDATAGRVRLEHLDRKDRQTGEARRLAVNVQGQRLDVLNRQTTLEADRIELRRLYEQLEVTRQLSAKSIESRLALTDIQLQHDSLKAKVAESEVALREAQGLAAQAEARLKAHTVVGEPELDVQLEPIRAAVTAQEARVREWESQVRLLTIQAPVSGTIVAINRRAGQAVRMGDVIMTIAAGESRYVMSYIRQHQRIRPEVGMAVEVRGRSNPRQPVSAWVDRVGSQVEPVPPHLLLDPKVPEWGLPVRIAIPEDPKLQAGELVDVSFRLLR